MEREVRRKKGFEVFRKIRLETGPPPPGCSPNLSSCNLKVFLKLKERFWRRDEVKGK